MGDMYGVPVGNGVVVSAVSYRRPWRIECRKMCRKVLCCRGKAVPIELQRPEALCKYQL